MSAITGTAFLSRIYLILPSVSGAEYIHAKRTLVHIRSPASHDPGLYLSVIHIQGPAQIRRQSRGGLSTNRSPHVGGWFALGRCQCRLSSSPSGMAGFWTLDPQSNGGVLLSQHQTRTDAELLLRVGQAAHLPGGPRRDSNLETCLDGACTRRPTQLAGAAPIAPKAWWRWWGSSSWVRSGRATGMRVSKIALRERWDETGEVRINSIVAVGCLLMEWMFLWSFWARCEASG